MKDSEGKTVETNTYLKFNILSGTYSTLEKVTIGNNVTIGAAAFMGNARLSLLTLGEGAAIGNYAFYNNVSLLSADLS